MQDNDSIQSWSIIILCYNEEGNIKHVIADVQDVLKKIAPKQNEIVLVNDGSTDNSLEIIESMLKLSENSNLNFINHSKNKGIGEALHSGYQHAKYENVVMLPGDGQFDTTELIPYKSFPAKTMISFYRRENTIYSPFRNILSFFNKKLNEFFLGLVLRDVNWVKVYKNSDLKTLNLEIRSSLVESEIICQDGLELVLDRLSKLSNKQLKILYTLFLFLDVSKKQEKNRENILNLSKYDKGHYIKWSNQKIY